MQYGLIKSLADSSNECLVLGIFEDEGFQKFNQLNDKPLLELLPRLSEKLHDKGDMLWQSEIDGRALLLVQCGKSDEFDANELRQRMKDITAALTKQHIKEATIYLPQIIDHDANWQVMQMILQMASYDYQLMDFKTQNRKEHACKAVTIYLDGADESSLDVSQAIAAGIHLTRTLADLPANRCTPTFLGEQALKLGQQHELLDVTVYDKEQIRKMGMDSFLAVAQGSEEPPRFIEMHYKNGGDKAPIVLVGKGITFDSGGLSIKPANAMDEMKYDMAGAASVLGTLHACALLKLPINVIGLIASTENMPSGCALKPGDIINSLSGQTIEVLNTDAEGRLILADALTYAEQFNPAFVIDIATLTGAMVIALGHVTTGFMTNDQELAEEILQAAAESYDKAWQMPLDEAYQEALESPLADMINASCSDRTAGSITAACFLSRFTKKYRWAHLDIAGTAWVSGKKRAATGRPVPLLVQLLRHASTR